MSSVSGTHFLYCIEIGGSAVEPSITTPTSVPFMPPLASKFRSCVHVFREFELFFFHHLGLFVS